MARCNIHRFCAGRFAIRTEFSLRLLWVYERFRRVGMVFKRGLGIGVMMVATVTLSVPSLGQHVAHSLRGAIH